MRTGILGLVGAVLAAAPLGRAADPPLPAVLSSQQAGTPPPAVPPSLPTAPVPPPTLPENIGAPANPPASNSPNSPNPPQSPAAAACSQPPNKTAWHDCHCGPPEQFWLSGGYLAWWVKDQRFTSTLVTTSATPGAPTTIAFGGQDISYGTFNGVTLDGGMWLNCRHTFGIDLNGFWFGTNSVTETFGTNGTGARSFFRPITDAVTLQPVNVIVAAPGEPGAVSITTKSQLAGAGINTVLNQSHTEDYTVDYLAGFRYIDLEERLTLAQTTNAPGLAFNGTTVDSISLLDDFHTRNQFYGGLIGSRGEYHFGPWFVAGSSSIALGPNHEVLEINGKTTGGGTTLPGGLLAVGGGTQTVFGPNGLPTAFENRGNIGRYTTNRFIAVPEASAEIGAYVTSSIRVAIGYNFLYMTDTLRPGRQVNTLVNPAFVPSSPFFGTAPTASAAPFVTGRREDFHAQGIKFTAEVRY